MRNHPERLAVSVVCAGVAAPMLDVVLETAGCPWLPAALASAAAFVVAVSALGRYLPRRLDGMGSSGSPRQRLACVLWLLLGAVAIGQSARLSSFMLDPARTGDSVIPSDDFLVHHSCFT